MLEYINLYGGFDERQEVGFHTFVSSVIHLASIPVQVMPIGNALLKGLSGVRREDESTDFAHARFLVPWLQGFTGWAIFCDASDMLLRTDIAELYARRDDYKAVQVVKHDYRTKHPRKFVGTPMEASNRDYPGKNSSSVMIINCAHFAWRMMTPEVVAKMSGMDLHQFRFIRPEQVGSLPVEWNWLVDEYGANADAKLLHWTAGIPAFPYYANAPMADEWAQAALNVGHVALLPIGLVGVS